MRRSIKYYLCALLVVALNAIMLSCTKSESGNIEYLPFQETKDGNWGMISVDGKVLFKDEFKTRPTVVRDGRFFVRTKQGIWEMYDVSEKPQKIGTEYAHISGFDNGHAVVSEKGKPVSIIDKGGNTVKLLDKINGKLIDGVRCFVSGYAVFMTTDSLCGVIDKDGNCVVKPEYYSLNSYGDGKFIGVNVKYKDFVKKGKKDKVKISVLDTSGKEILSFSANKYENIGYQFVDGKLAVSVKKDGKETWGIIDEKGEYVVKPSTKLKEIGSINGDEFTYNNGEGWGLMNVKGETLVRAKYELLYFAQDDILIAMVKDGDTYEYKYIDKKDNQIGTDTYVEATPFSAFDGNHAFVKPNDKIYSIIDKNCNQIEGLPDIIDIGSYDGEGYVESDFVDIKKLVDGFKITQNGTSGLTFSSSPKDVVKVEVAQGDAVGDESHPAGTPYWYDFSSTVSFSKNVEGIYGSIKVRFPGTLSEQTYRTHRVIDYTYGDWYWYHDEKTPTGYVWNKMTPQSFNLSISNNGRMHGKLRELLNAFITKFKSFGKIEKQNDGAAVLKLNNKLRAAIWMEKDQVVVSWGNIGVIDISKYKNASEEYDQSGMSYGYLNSLFPRQSLYDEDSVALVDSTATEADSVMVDYDY